jgi:hypothetical protein
MIHIRTANVSIQVFHDEILLATFSSMEAAIEYSKVTEQKLSGGQFVVANSFAKI